MRVWGWRCVPLELDWVQYSSTELAAVIYVDCLCQNHERKPKEEQGQIESVWVLYRFRQNHPGVSSDIRAQSRFEILLETDKKANAELVLPLAAELVAVLRQWQHGTADDDEPELAVQISLDQHAHDLLQHKRTY